MMDLLGAWPRCLQAMAAWPAMTGSFDFAAAGGAIWAQHLAAQPDHPAPRRVAAWLTTASITS